MPAEEEERAMADGFVTRYLRPHAEQACRAADIEVMFSKIQSATMDGRDRGRIHKELADQITKIVSSNGKEGWSFAAPAEIHSAIVELLPPAVRDRIVEHVKSDLVKMESAKLISRFRSLQQI